MTKFIKYLIYRISKKMLNSLVFVSIICGAQTKVDMIIYNATIYTIDKNFSIVEAMAIKDGKIVETGSTKFILEKYESTSKTDMNKKFIYPGFIDAHCHFVGYALSLNEVNLTGTKSFEEVIQRITEHYHKFKPQWLKGRGWDQNDWEIKEFPDRKKIDSLFPDIPVFLKRVDGHAALVNKKVLDLARINDTTKISGGEIYKKGEWITGILVDNAVDLVIKIIPLTNETEKIKILKEAQKNCFSVGLTTLSDAGLEKIDIDLIFKLQQTKELKIRIYAMANPTPENFQNYFINGIFKTDKLHVSSFKIYADGALGSKGACLKKPYMDKPESKGFLLNNVSFFDSIATLCYKNSFQMNTHCIGDSANSLLLKTYGKHLKGKNDRRWRIEHCQVVDSVDIQYFRDYSIIPSAQFVHATSDMYWAEKRLGKERVKNAYTYKKLLELNNMIAYGSDFPVEDINPLFGFYAAVVRKDTLGFPNDGFQTENKLSRVEALKAMTIWAAYANFEEKEKGSLEKGKWADFVVTDDDLMKAPENELFKIKINRTFVAGELIYDILQKLEIGN